MEEFIKAKLEDSFILYLIERFIYRVYGFFRHWYYDSFFEYSGWVMEILRRLDRTFAVRVNFHYLFHPLYQDYTVIGYTLGFIFRSIRITAGSLIYAIIIVIAAAIYLIWLLVPPALIFSFLAY